MAKTKEKIVCSNCDGPFHGLTACPEDAPRFVKARDKERNDALARAADLQSQYWDALSDLESALGVTVDGDLDLENETIEHLLEIAEEDK